MIQGNDTPVAFYRDGGGVISNLSTGTLVTSGNPITAGVSPVRALVFDASGNKSVAVPRTVDGVEQKGYQEQGYQAWGYYYYPTNHPDVAMRGVKSTTSITGP